jgi:CDP-paratose 2-epimerase
LSHHQLDIRDREGLSHLVKHQGPVDLLAHCAAQPNHDLAARRPFADFAGNATVALNVLEATHLQCPEAVFVVLSPNKVYGAAPKELPLRELA